MMLIVIAASTFLVHSLPLQKTCANGLPRCGIEVGDTFCFEKGDELPEDIGQTGVFYKGKDGCPEPSKDKEVFLSQMQQEEKTDEAEETEEPTNDTDALQETEESNTDALQETEESNETDTPQETVETARRIE